MTREHSNNFPEIMEGCPDKTYKACVLAMNSVTRFCKHNASGLNNIPVGQNYILAFAHHDSWDFLALAHALYKYNKTPVHFLAKQQLYESLIANLALRHLRTLPIERENPQNEQIFSQLLPAISIVRAGGVLATAPEGERVNGDQIPEELSKGVGVVACASNAAVVPVGIAGNQNSKPWIPRDMSLHFGEALYPQYVDPNSYSLDGINRMSELPREILVYANRFTREQLRPGMVSALQTAYSEYEQVFGHSAKLSDKVVAKYRK